ncbi:MAG: tetratricopeptide repeat protein [Pseudomonadota bacterium]
MRIVPGLAAAVLALAVALPAPAQESTAQLRQRLDRLAAEMADLRASLARGGGGSAAGLSVRLDRLEIELGRLTGQVEELAYRQRQIAEDGARRLGDIDFRLTELEGGDLSALAEQPPLGGVARAAAPPPAAAPSATPVATRDPALALAVEDIRQGRFDQGEARLQRLLSSGGDAASEAEARYWFGQSRFTRGDYNEAARAFLAGYNADQQGEAAPRNLLQLGITLGRLGQRREACLTLREVRNRFPGAERGLLDAADAEADRLTCSP